MLDSRGSFKSNTVRREHTANSKDGTGERIGPQRRFDRLEKERDSSGGDSDGIRTSNRPRERAVEYHAESASETEAVKSNKNRRSRSRSVSKVYKSIEKTSSGRRDSSSVSPIHVSVNRKRRDSSSDCSERRTTVRKDSKVESLPKKKKQDVRRDYSPASGDEEASPRAKVSRNFEDRRRCGSPESARKTEKVDRDKNANRRRWRDSSDLDEEPPRNRNRRDSRDDNTIDRRSVESEGARKTGRLDRDKYANQRRRPDSSSDRDEEPSRSRKSREEAAKPPPQRRRDSPDREESARRPPPQRRRDSPDREESTKSPQRRRDSPDREESAKPPPQRRRDFPDREEEPTRGRKFVRESRASVESDATRKNAKANRDEYDSVKHKVVKRDSCERSISPEPKRGARESVVDESSVPNNDKHGDVSTDVDTAVSAAIIGKRSILQSSDINLDTRVRRGKIDETSKVNARIRDSNLMKQLPETLQANNATLDILDALEFPVVDETDIRDIPEQLKNEKCNLVKNPLACSKASTTSLVTPMRRTSSAKGTVRDTRSAVLKEYIQLHYPKYRVVFSCTAKGCKYTFFHECHRAPPEAVRDRQEALDNDISLRQYLESRGELIHPGETHECMYCHLKIVHRLCYKEISAKKNKYIIDGFATRSESCSQCKILWARTMIDPEYKRMLMQTNPQLMKNIRDVTCRYDEPNERCLCGCTDIHHYCLKYSMGENFNDKNSLDSIGCTSVKNHTAVCK
ncbi:PREDICTED: serine/arginine repetitive matrix protein 2-like [Vollenhovia emeryi]|uniref:serine/arginine repetitive matrix protein 2-like n=1 Tax=Vollenhovia emeryi TaxID=411798 RepID=UPI0005F415EB|nr:PREDICTED: serine/arginine repetitive matrix protein 2-like [Vollenhovia emeryi]XP_011858248.1 PREDICTED: serine/arginine repetitive matrix protein 2-like [Vollenhovia emeryi]